MALQFIFGSSGSGKSSYIFRKTVEEAQRDLKKNYYVVVPEQFTMQTQRELVALQERRGIMNIDVVSFQRLAYRIFDELGMTQMAVLEETGKSLLLRKVAEERQEELTVLAANIRKMGYINEMKSLISELTQYNVSPEDLEEFLTRKDMPRSLSGKLQDVLIMYRGFRQELEGRYITAEEVLELFADVANRSDLLPGAVLVFDGFTGFTPIQNQVLLRLMKLVQDIYVTVTLDRREDPYSYHDMQELFAMSKKMVKGLLHMASLAGIDVAEPVHLGCGAPGRFEQAPGLQFLEQNIFRGGSTNAGHAGGEIQILSLPDPRVELMYVAGEIARLTRTEGYRYCEIAVISGAVEEYGNYVPQIFERFDIPFFLDTTRVISMHPLIEFVRAVLKVVEEHYSYEAVFRYLRCGLSRISEEEIDALENYVLAAGIRGRKKWEARFALLPNGMTEEELEAVNEVRERVIKPFVALQEVFGRRGVTVQERCIALYEFITFHQIEEQMNYRKMKYEQACNYSKAKEYDQIYRIVMDLLDKLAGLLGEERMSLEEFARILDSGFETAKVGVIPGGYDRVLVGDIERSRLDHVKVLFMVGVNDGIVPKNDSRGGIISQIEREEMARGNIELSPTPRERVFMQRFYLYLAMTKPSRRLYVSYARIGTGGESLRPSYLIHTVKGIFEDVDIRYIREDEVNQALRTAESSVAYLLEGMSPGADWNGNKEELWQTLVCWYRKHEDMAPRLERLINAAGAGYHEEAISRAVAGALYGRTLVGSATRLEQYAACACRHFLAYGLGLRERDIFGFYMTDIGTIYHCALQRYADRLQQQGIAWDGISEQQQKEWALLAMDEAIAQIGNAALADNAGSRYQAEKMKRIFQRTIWALTRQISQGRFTPSRFEVSFSFTSEMPRQDVWPDEQEKLQLTGRIDRIDTYEDQDRVYVKIVDYKSGSQGYELLSLYHGLQLQLVVYMNAAMELFAGKYGDKEIVPAGMLYYHLDDPFIEGKGTESEEEIQREILGRLRPDGVVSTDGDVYRAMDTELSGRSMVIPLTVNKDGSVRAGDSAVDAEQFAVMRSYADILMRRAGTAILEGDTAARPCRLKDKSSCTYCPYGFVCGFDRKIPGSEPRQLEVLPPEEIYRRMKEDAGK